MKWQIFLEAATVCLATAAIAANALAQDTFDQGIVDSVTIGHPIFAKVFPRVEFRIYTSEVTMPRQRRIRAVFEGQKYGMPGYFYKLYAIVRKDSEADIRHQMEAYVRLSYWKRDPNITILSLENVNIQTEDGKYNYRMVARVLPPECKAFENVEILVAVKENRIVQVEFHDKYMIRWIEHPSTTSSMDNVGLEIIGIGPMQYIHPNGWVARPARWPGLF